MSIFSYKDLNINYERSGTGIPVFFLHGWGTDLESFNVLTEDLSKEYEVFSLDFPGFGKSNEPITPWSLDDYTLMTVAFIESMQIINPVVVGHSFGGRVSIKLSQLINLDKIILINSAGIKPKRHFSYYFKVYGFKFFRILAKLPVISYVLKEPLNAYSTLYSSSDYKMATPMMKQILSKVVNEDLKEVLPKIKAPVLLIWGDQDTSTPLDDAKVMESLIPDAGLVIFEGAGHFSYVEQPSRILTIMKTFIGGNK